jgi:APA family basic amino acid/polyamine antiporter
MAIDKRPFGFWTATALVVGGMIGSGIFVLPGQLAPYGWTGAAAWVIGVSGALVLAWVMTRLAAQLPASTGAVAICASALGPLPGVLVGWSYWVGVWSANAVIALTAAKYLAVFWPPIGESALTVALTAIGLIWLLTLLNLAGARVAGQFQVLTTALKLLPLVAVVVLLAGLVFASGGKQFVSAPHPGFDVLRLTPALTLVFFAIVGFESASVAAERVRDPARNITRATMTGLALTGVLYVLVCTGVVFSLPQETLEAANAPIAYFVEHFWGHEAGLAVAAFTVIAAVGCLNGWILVQGEVPLGMARAGVLPAWIARTNKRDVPTGVLLVSSTLASIMLLSNASGTTSVLMDFMLRLTAAATLWLYIGSCFAALVLGSTRVAALVGLVFALWTLVGSGFEALGLSLLLMLTAVPLYYFALRGGAAKPA